MDYILETFPIVKRKDEKLSGEYRTKRVILERRFELRSGQSKLHSPPDKEGAWHN